MRRHPGWCRCSSCKTELAFAEYAAQVSQHAAERQREAQATRCPDCWAWNGTPHTPFCPQAPDPDEPPTQDEALF